MPSPAHEGTPLSIYEAVLGQFDHSAPPEQSVIQAYGSLLPDRLSASEIVLEIDALHDVASKVDVRDLPLIAFQKAVSLRSIEAMVGNTRGLTNTLTDWPNYAHLMAEHGRVTGGNVLMIGTASALSSKAFSVLSEEVYGADRSLIMDIVTTRDVYKQGTFVSGDALSLPFADNSIAYVHTNHLLHQLRHPGLKHRIATHKLFAEIGRVLAPGGQLFMTERASYNMHNSYDTSKRGEYLVRLLSKAAQQTGLEVSIDPYISFDTNDYLFDRQRDFSGRTARTLESMRAVYGQKVSR